MLYPFRAPIFPVLFNAGTVTVFAETRAKLNRYVQQNASKMPDRCQLIDYNWAEWTLCASELMVVPAIAIRQFTKRQLLQLCGVSEDQISAINLDRYSRKQIFDYGIVLAKRGCQPVQTETNQK